MEENKIQEPQEKKKSVNIASFIMIIALIMIGAGVFLTFTSNKGQENNPVQKEETNQEKEISEADKELLLERIDSIYNKTFPEYYPLSNISEITNQDLLRFGQKLVSELNGKNGIYNVPIPSQQIEDEIHKYFGNDVKITHENIMGLPSQKLNTSEVLYKYDDTTKTYTYNNDAHYTGPVIGGWFGTIDELYLSGLVKGNTYTIKTKLLYGEYLPYNSTAGCVHAFYATNKDSINKKNPVVGNMDSCYEPETITEEDFNKVKDQLPVTTYTFVKSSDGNFALTKVTVE